jgi:protein-tyrosine phosphatase
MAYDVVIEMEDISGKKYQPEKVALLLDVLHPGENRGVPDPCSRTEPHYHSVYTMIEQACDAIIAKAIAKQ